MLETQGSRTVSYELEDFQLNERKYTSEFNFLLGLYFFVLLRNYSYHFCHWESN